MNHRFGVIGRLCVRYRVAIAGIVLCAQYVFPGGCFADFSSADFARIWQEEIGSKLSDAPESSRSAAAPLGSLPFNLASRSRHDSPHPAVVRVVVPEGESTSYGSGTLVDVREQYGLVITNWHVVRDARGPIEVTFPSGQTSKARALKVDPDWDLAALVIWNPQVEPVKIAEMAPLPGDRLTICGYGPGIYRAATGRCTQYYSPHVNLPQQMVELDVEARQGDSGGPIFNDRGELAGVLFGAGQGTTLGSFGGRVESFLATLAPDIGRQSDQRLAQEIPSTGSLSQTEGAASEDVGQSTSEEERQSSKVALAESTTEKPTTSSSMDRSELLSPPTFEGEGENSSDASINTVSISPQEPDMEIYPPRQPLFEQLKTVLAAIGLLSLAVMLLKAAG